MGFYFIEEEGERYREPNADRALQPSLFDDISSLSQDDVEETTKHQPKNIVERTETVPGNT